MNLNYISHPLWTLLRRIGLAPPRKDSPMPKLYSSERIGPAQTDSPATTGLSDYQLFFGPEPRQGDSPTAGLSDYRSSAPSPRKPYSLQQPINCTNTCRGVSHMVPLLRFCALGFGHGTVFPWGCEPNSRAINFKG